MSNKLRWLLIALVATAAASVRADTGAARDWSAAPAIFEAAAPSEIIAVGDVHGDYERLVELLAVTHVIASTPSSPADAKWAAGKATLVCTGDVIDKYTRSLDAIALFRALEPQAAAAGGRVVVTMGNHEAEFLAGGGTNKKAADFEAELQAAGIAPADVAQGRDALGIGAWLRARPIAAEIGDWFFCHAGDTGGMSLSDLRTAITQGVTAQGFGAPILSAEDSILEARLHPHPWWEEAGKAKGKKAKAAAEATDEADLRADVTAVGAKHLVMGHQPGEVKFADKSTRAADTMISKFNGLLFLIDVGMSRGVDGALGTILIIHGADTTHPTASAWGADGSTHELWKS